MDVGVFLLEIDVSNGLMLTKMSNFKLKKIFTHINRAFEVYMFLFSLGIKPTTLALLAQCSTS